ncbi:hypothetical protein LOKO_02729 [Halomonas chromatireducens]|uniref:Uncharacterized protein n=1 Tax=Halomonas chromatireducens TaxID=507626 RepID=A0A125R0E0_9GAMM|nr:hypothetical protein LOKO_02729 [Halomonas chromatireducens]
MRKENDHIAYSSYRPEADDQRVLFLGKITGGALQL